MSAKTSTRPRPTGLYHMEPAPSPHTLLCTEFFYLFPGTFIPKQHEGDRLIVLLTPLSPIILSVKHQQGMSTARTRCKLCEYAEITVTAMEEGLERSRAQRDGKKGPEVVCVLKCAFLSSSRALPALQRSTGASAPRFVLTPATPGASPSERWGRRKGSMAGA